MGSSWRLLYSRTALRSCMLAALCGSEVVLLPCVAYGSYIGFRDWRFRS
jgi:hypothetical protein